MLRLSRAAVDALNRHDRLLAVSQATRSYHVAQGIAPETTNVMYNGVDLDAFRPRAASGRLHALLGIGRENALVGAVGQIVMRKGHDVLATATKQVVEAFPATHFVIVGERYSVKEEAVRYESELRAAFTDGCGASNVHFLGWRDDMADCLSELTVLAHPARQEPLGRVLLEAAACGVPTVATDVGGTREIFADEAAVLVPADDAEQLAAGIRRILADAELRKRLGAAARRRAETMFDAQRAGEELAGHYDEVLAGVTSSRGTEQT